MPSINGRPVLGRAEMVDRGVPLTTAKWLYRHREVTRHPEAANPGGKPLVWYQDEWEPWYEQYRRAPGQGPKPGTPSPQAKSHPYADDPRLTAVIGWLGESRTVTARSVQTGLAGLGHPVSPSVAARILTVAKAVTNAEQAAAETRRSAAS